MAQNKNVSFAHPSKYRLVFPFFEFMTGNERAESVVINCSEVKLPGVTMTPEKVGTPYHDMRIVSPNVQWGDLQVTYHVDELYENYEILWSWFMYMKDPERLGMHNTEGMVDASIMIYSNNDNPRFRWNLKNIFPVSFGELLYTKKATDADDLEQAVVFSMDYFSLERL